ncbi:MAG: prolyl-tRNA synthetase associated domain-containing protein [Candidatus Saccharicenans sp.]|nr:MAG: prolyl-tRNA synthetase associated domain-containing protein [Candidatus Aminicenantes bacterium]HEK86135.1 prolyl-tRNA synthetase associated domain-containing protein [Candidatus Aminicenantes bacterium]
MVPELTDEEKKLFKILSSLNINWKRYSHPPVFTLSEAQQYWQGTSGAHGKNLFLRNYKGNHHYLVIVEAGKNVNLKKLNAYLKEDRLSFASPERLKKFLGVLPGAVSPFGLINDTNKEVVVVIDQDLLGYSSLNFHPNVNTATLEISQADFQKFLNWSGQKIIYWKIESPSGSENKKNGG